MSFKFNLNTPFPIFLIEVDKKEKLKPRQVREGIVFIPLDKFFDFFSCMEENAIWWSFNMKELVHKKTGRLCIWTKENTLYLQVL